MSAVMSSADSILNSSTAIFMKDLFEKYLLNSKMSGGAKLRVARGSSVVLGALGILLALVLPNVIDLLLLTYNLWAPGIIVPVIAGVFIKEKSPGLNMLIFVTMVISIVATVFFMMMDISGTVQPSILGVIVSCVIFFTGFLGLRLSSRDA
jgi:SSS family solute:Na+ symporter